MFMFMFLPQMGVDYMHNNVQIADCIFEILPLMIRQSVNVIKKYSMCVTSTTGILNVTWQSMNS